VRELALPRPVYQKLRLDLIDVANTQSQSFGAAVAYALGTQPKKPLPPKYFYDDLGSALFEAITNLPEYYLTRAEREILHDFAPQMLALFHGPLDIVELGNGSSLKTRLLVQEVLRRQGTLHYWPIDTSRATLESAGTLGHRFVSAGKARARSAYSGCGHPRRFYRGRVDAHRNLCEVRRRGDRAARAKE
jgi:hypothetical protein